MEEDPLSELPWKEVLKSLNYLRILYSKRLIEELNINPELQDIQIKRLQDVIVKNQRAFGI